MKLSNLAQRLEEFEADLLPLRLTPSTTVRFDIAPEAPAQSELPARPVRRRFRAGSLRNRDQGLRAFRVC